MTVAHEQLTDELPRLHRWFDRHKRDLPWRRTRDPYAIWLSEVMLQQTRVAAVVPYYDRFLRRFPTVTTLARADEQEVLALWEGLGYYARARSLHRAAREVMNDHEGVIPDTPEVFRRLPGVGEYTAAAVMSFAFDHDLAAVDGNVRRVIARLLAIEGDPREAPAAAIVHTAAAALLPLGRAALHNQSMMELGALICVPRRPRCDECPLRDACAARATGAPERFPTRRVKRTVPHVDVAVGIVRRAATERSDTPEVFIDRRPSTGLLGGLWEFPGGKLEPGETPEDALHRELAEEFGLSVAIETALPPVDHAYTHFKVTLFPFLCRFVAMEPIAGETAPWRFVPWSSLGDYPMPRANRKILQSLGSRG